MYSRVGEYMYSPNVYSPSIHHRKNMYSPFCSIQIRSIHVLTKTVLTDLVNTLRSIHMYSPSCIHRDYTVVTTPYCSLQIWGLLSINGSSLILKLEGRAKPIPYHKGMLYAEKQSPAWFQLEKPANL